MKNLTGHLHFFCLVPICAERKYFRTDKSFRCNCHLAMKHQRAAKKLWHSARVSATRNQGEVTSIDLCQKHFENSNRCCKNNSCSRIFNAVYQPISLPNRQEISVFQVSLLNKPSAKINSIKFLSTLEGKSAQSHRRICASSYLNHSAIRLTLLSGNRQTAPANTQLAKPLSIVALSAAGEPLANLPISFDILRGTGKRSEERRVGKECSS